MFVGGGGGGCLNRFCWVMSVSVLPDSDFDLVECIAGSGNK